MITLDNAVIEYFRKIAVNDNDADEIEKIIDANHPNVKKSFSFIISEEDIKKFPILTVDQKLIIFVDERNKVVYSDLK